MGTEDKEKVLNVLPLLDTVHSDIAYLVNQFIIDNKQEALNKFPSVIDSLVAIVNYLQALAGRGFFSSDVSLLDKLNALLAEMLEALENKDYVYLSDLLQELADSLSEIKNIITAK